MNNSTENHVQERCLFRRAAGTVALLAMPLAIITTPIAWQVLAGLFNVTNQCSTSSAGLVWSISALANHGLLTILLATAWAEAVAFAMLGVIQVLILAKNIKQQHRKHMSMFVGICILVGLVTGNEIVVWIRAVSILAPHGMVAWMTSMSASLMVLAAAYTLFGGTGIEWELAHAPDSYPREPKLFRKDMHNVGLGFLINTLALIATLMLALFNYPKPQPSIVLWNMFCCACLVICELIVFTNYKDAIRELQNHERSLRHMDECDNEYDEEPDDEDEDIDK
jgi:hypothetical protein